MKFELNDWNVREPSFDVVSLTSFVKDMVIFESGKETPSFEIVKDHYEKALIRYASSNVTNAEKGNIDRDFVKTQASQLLYLLSTEQFEPGDLSKADNLLEDIYDQYGSEHTVDLLNDLTMKCQGSQDLHCYLHFLNVVKNALDYVSYDKVKLIPFVAIAYDNIYVKEAAIGIFEGIEFDNVDILNDVINALSHSDTSKAKWVNTYKLKVIEELKSVEL
ncbi:hypothetical protein ABUV06_001419 [Vibrio alginolyticus]